MIRLIFGNTTRPFSQQKGRVFSSWGFSLIELMIAVSIIGVLTTIGLVSFNQANKGARDGKRRADMEQVRAALVLYRTDVGSYPVKVDWTGMVSVVRNYLSTSSVQDPKPSPYVQYQYSYVAATNGFTICAILENPSLENPSGAAHCLNSP